MPPTRNTRPHKPNAAVRRPPAAPHAPVPLTKVTKGERLLKQLIARADVNGDGYVSDTDLSQTLRAIGSNKRDVSEAIRAAQAAGRSAGDRSVSTIQAKITAAKQKIVDADVSGNRKIDPDERKRLRGRGAKLAGALLDFSATNANKKISSFGLSRPHAPPAAEAGDYGHVSREGTPAEVMQRIVKRWNRLSGDNYWPGHQHIRSVLGKQEAHDVAGEIATLPRTLARAVLRELSRAIVAGGANSIWADADGQRELKRVARRFSIQSSFAGPERAPPFPGY